MHDNSEDRQTVADLADFTNLIFAPFRYTGTTYSSDNVMRHLWNQIDLFLQRNEYVDTLERWFQLQLTNCGHELQFFGVEAIKLHG